MASPDLVGPGANPGGPAPQEAGCVTAAPRAPTSLVRVRILAGLFFMSFVAGRSGSVIYGQNGLGRAVRPRTSDRTPRPRRHSFNCCGPERIRLSPREREGGPFGLRARQGDGACGPSRFGGLHPVCRPRPQPCLHQPPRPPERRCEMSYLKRHGTRRVPSGRRSPGRASRRTPRAGSPGRSTIGPGCAGS
jgi:hypothetical protein